MKYFLPALFITFFSLFQHATAQTVTGLDDWSLFIDPGHSQTENMGLYNYSEPEKVLRVGLALRDMLFTQTDIDTVYMSRTTDSEQVSLSQRTDLANFLAPDFYHSIHSNAGSSTANNTLFLHGGWRSNGQTVEKTPNGGKLMGDIMEVELTGAMRIPTIGNFADRNFYQGGSVQNHSNQYPYLHVNRTTNMASVLSEGGFHTNPTQQQRNLNAEWKRLEAQSHFWSTLEYMEAERPTVGIATGYITDSGSEETINGASVSIDGQTYVTDTYASLFNEYTSDPEALSNGFYYIEDLPNGPNQLIVEAEGYYSDTLDVDILSDDFTFTDVELTSSVPPFVESVSVEDSGSVPVGDFIIITFSRDMDIQSVENAFSISDSADVTLSWTSFNTLRVRTNNLDFLTEYTITIADSAHDQSEFEHGLDGDGDGEAGGDYTLTFESGPEDTSPPAISTISPGDTEPSGVQPIINVNFDELLNPASINSETAIKVSINDYEVPGTLKHYTVNEKSALNFFPSEKLAGNNTYTITVSGDLEDQFGNAIGADITHDFSTGDEDIDAKVVIDNFDNGISNWWDPSQSGSTNAIIGEETESSSDSETVNLISGSSSSMKVNYGWDTNSSGHLIRVYTPSNSPVFTSSHTLQVYVFGDGNGNQFRFMIEDASGYEGSKWYTIDWIGWKLVSWDLSEDEVVAWVNGDGTLTGNLNMDSFQLTYTQGQPNIGFINFDDAQAVTFKEAVSIEEPFASDVPNNITLDQNYPNPFNPTTNIRFGLPERSDVNLTVYDMLGKKVAEVYSGVKTAGYHTLQFDASRLASGVYIYRLETSLGVSAKKMILMK